MDQRPLPEGLLAAGTVMSCGHAADSAPAMPRNLDPKVSRSWGVG